METIEIDGDVFDFLKNKAEPFVDTPNSVLRRLLLGGVAELPATELNGSSKRQPRGEERSNRSSDQFVRQCLSHKFKGQFSVRSPYRMMFESPSEIVYFQNFNRAGTSNLWYRLNSPPLSELRSSGKRAFVCLTNPAERRGFLIPLEEIDQKAKSVRWDRPELEVNIDSAVSRWREFDWQLNNFEFNVGDA